MMPERGMNSREVLVKSAHFINAIALAAKNPSSYARHCQALAYPLKNLLPLIDEIQMLEVPVVGGVFTVLEGLQSLLVKAKDLIHDSGQETSQVYAVLRSDKTTHKFAQLAAELAAQVSLLLLNTLQVSNSTKEQVEKCISALQTTVFEKEVGEDLIKETELALLEIREGKKLPHEKLVHLASKFHLRLNQEILKEASLLERKKEHLQLARDKHEEDFVSQLIILFTQMGDDLVEQRQAQVEFGGIPVPADFLCPLSLEMMSDPVIVASGQTYERSYIQQWLDQGNTTCPKTRQVLSHTNLIPNYTVKALIASWCETNCVLFPESSKLGSPTMQAACVPMLKFTGGGSGQMQESQSKEPTMVSIPPSSQEVCDINGNTCHQLLDGQELKACPVFNMFAREDSIANRRHVRKHSGAGKYNEGSSHGHSGNTSSSSSADDAMFNGAFDESAAEVHEPRTTALSARCNSFKGGDMQRNAMFSSFRLLNQRVRAPSALLNTNRGILRGLREERSVDLTSSTVSPSASDDGGDDATEEILSQLIEDLQSNSVDTQRNAAITLRILSKHSMDNRSLIATCGAIGPLVSLLGSTDTLTQENAVTALCNLSINDNNKSKIAAAGAIDPLINVLRVGSPEAKENSAATLFSLSVMDDNKIAIGQSGATLPLVDLLMHGTPRGKKDAATALFNLSILHENKVRIVNSGAVRPLVELMTDPAVGMVDKAVAVLFNLATISEGRAAIGEEGGIPALVEVVEMGSQKGKENAAAALLHLCTNSPRFLAIVLQEGAIPPLVALSQSGTARAKEKASALLRHFREQRQAVLGRGGGPERHMDRD